MFRVPSHIPISLLVLAAFSGCSQNPVTWWQSVNAKAKRLSELEANYHALEHEHEHLKKDYYRLENDYLELRAKVESVETGDRNLRATGSLEGRTLSSIAYQVPKGLRPEEELALGYEHFTEHRFPEAAATFEDFLKRPESAAVADAAAMYTAGVAWFQLGNYTRARARFEEAKQNAAGEQREKIHKKVDLWLRSIDRKEKEGAASPEKDSGHGTLGG